MSGMHAAPAFWAKRRAAAAIGRRIGRAWHYAAPAFAAGMDWLRANPEAFRHGELIWQHGSNHVYRLALPETCGGDDIVYKHTVGKRRWNHCVSASAAVREAVNIFAMADLGFPMIDLLAVGERRGWRCWSEAFLVSRFAAGYQDGRHLLPGFTHGEDLPLRNAFVTQALGHLAGMHARGIYHKGYKVYNILWKPAGFGEGVELLFLDVASCRMPPWRPRLRHLLRDLGHFLKPFGFAREEVERWLAVYLAAGAPLGFTPAALMDRLDPWLARAGFNWGQVEASRVTPGGDQPTE